MEYIWLRDSRNIEQVVLGHSVRGGIFFFNVLKVNRSLNSKKDFVIGLRYKYKTKIQLFWIRKYFVISVEHKIKIICTLRLTLQVTKMYYEEYWKIFKWGLGVDEVYLYISIFHSIIWYNDNFLRCVFFYVHTLRKGSVPRKSVHCTALIHIGDKALTSINVNICFPSLANWNNH